MTQENETMSIEEVADFLGVSVSTIRTRVRDGELMPRPKPAGAKRIYKLIFDRAEVERFKAANS